MQSLQKSSLWKKIKVIPKEKVKKGAGNIVMHEVIHNMHRKLPQVWYRKTFVKVENLFWDL